MIRRPPRSTLTVTLFPFPMLFRSAKAARSGCLMYDHAPAGFPHRNLDGFDVERNECAQVDNLRIYVQIGYGAGNHMNHGAIAKNGKRLPFPYYPRLAQVEIGRASCRERVCKYV